MNTKKIVSVGNTFTGIELFTALVVSLCQGAVILGLVPFTNPSQEEPWSWIFFGGYFIWFAVVIYTRALGYAEQQKSFNPYIPRWILLDSYTGDKGLLIWKMLVCSILLGGWGVYALVILGLFALYPVWFFGFLVLGYWVFAGVFLLWNGLSYYSYTQIKQQ